MFLGSWSFEFTEEGPKVELDFGVLTDFNLVWYVYEIEEDVVKFYSDNDNKIILKRRCDEDDDHDNDNGEGGEDNGIISIETLTNNTIRM